jgi:hypothetical protein
LLLQSRDPLTDSIRRAAVSFLARSANVAAVGAAYITNAQPGDLRAEIVLELTTCLQILTRFFHAAGERSDVSAASSGSGGCGLSLGLIGSTVLLGDDCLAEALTPQVAAAADWVVRSAVPGDAMVALEAHARASFVDSDFSSLVAVTAHCSAAGGLLMNVAGATLCAAALAAAPHRAMACANAHALATAAAGGPATPAATWAVESMFAPAWRSLKLLFAHMRRLQAAASSSASAPNHTSEASTSARVLRSIASVPSDCFVDFVSPCAPANDDDDCSDDEADNAATASSNCDVPASQRLIDSTMDAVLFTQRCLCVALLTVAKGIAHDRQAQAQMAQTLERTMHEVVGGGGELPPTAGAAASALAAGSVEGLMAALQRKGILNID